MASKRNDEIVFLSATVSNKPKSNQLRDFVAKNRATDLGLSIKREKVYEVIEFFIKIKRRKIFFTVLLVPYHKVILYRNN